MLKSLFFMDTTDLCGGSRVLLEMSRRLADSGQHVDLFVRNRVAGTEWFDNPLPVLNVASIEEALACQTYDFIFFAHSFLIPLALPHHQQARPVLICQSYEAFCEGKTYADSFRESETFSQVLKLPIEVISISRSIQALLRQLFRRYSFPIEFHYRPSPEIVSDIYASCHLYCCASWYEGLGLPALESFAVGTPVVSTASYRVTDYGVDNENLLIVAPDNVDDLYSKMRELLTNETLAQRLAENARLRAQTYRWSTSIEALIATQNTMMSESRYDDAKFPKEEMEQLIAMMKAATMLAPVESMKLARKAAGRIEEINQSIKDKVLSRQDAVVALQGLQQELGTHLSSEGRGDPCHNALSASHNLCRMLIALSDDEDAFFSAFDIM